jgi:hypothetical protein
MLLMPAAPSFTQAQVIKSGPSSCPGVALTFDLCPVRNGTGYDQALIDWQVDRETRSASKGAPSSSIL